MTDLTSIDVQKLKDPPALGRSAAQLAAQYINAAIAEKACANIILATGTSQFETLKNLTQANIDWSKVNLFHLDEYLGISADHPASFCAYLQERFIDQVTPLNTVHLISGAQAKAEATCRDLSQQIAHHPIDVALIGIGENGHLAFNDPPADFAMMEPFIVVTLDEACRQQQLGEGWFPTLEEVPTKAISMSIQQIMKSKCLIVSVPDLRKAKAVKAALQGPVDPMQPASILQTHPQCHLFLDEASASLL
ncbi:MAG: glucosamine-6-phosphate deaminase [Bacteroidota bacterium]